MWNYGIVEEHSVFGVREIYYDTNGLINGWSSSAEVLTSDNPDDLLVLIDHLWVDMRKDIIHVCGNNLLENSCDRQTCI